MPIEEHAKALKEANTIHEARKPLLGLIRNGSSEAVKALIENGLKNDNLEIAEKSTIALGFLADESAIPALLEHGIKEDGMHNQNKKVTYESIVALTHIGTKKAIRALVDHCMRKTDGTTQSYLKTAAQKAQDPYVKKKMLEIIDKKINNPDKEDEGPFTGSYLRNEMDLKKQALEILEGYKDSEVAEKLAEYAFNKKKGTELIGKALNTLGTMGQLAFKPTLKHGLESDDPQNIANAAKVFLATEDKRAVPALIKALENKEYVKADLGWTNDGMVANALGLIGDKKAVPALIKALKHKSMKQSVINALGELGDKRALPHLMRMSGEEDSTDRYVREAITKIQEAQKKTKP